QFVAFQSDDNDLIANVSGRNVYLRNLSGTPVTTLVNFNKDNTGPGNAAATDPAITPNGQFVVFVSSATDLSATVTATALQNVYVRNLQSQTNQVASVNTTGTATGNGPSANSVVLGFDAPAITPDGSAVAFTSGASDLVTNDTNGHDDVFVHN